MRPISNPPNPWLSTDVEWIGEPPDAELQVFEEESKTILSENDSPDVGMRFSLNPYRGCQHACSYCVAPTTPVLRGDGRAVPIADLRVGDEIYGTSLAGQYRRYTRTRVLAHWSTVRPAFRVTLEDGTMLVASGDHRFLTERGWKHVSGEGRGPGCRPHLTVHNSLLGTGRFASPPVDSAEYRRGYLCGIIRGDGLLRSNAYPRGERQGKQYQFRLALVDLEALQRSAEYLRELDVSTERYLFQVAVGARKPMEAIRTHARGHFHRIQGLTAWPSDPTVDWRKGFLAGIFDAEGSYSGGCLRIANQDPQILETSVTCLRALGFDCIRDRTVARDVEQVRVRRGIREHLRFFHTVAPAITRKREIEGLAIKNDAALRVVAVEPLGIEMPMFDITTGTGDFIADGVVSHNCYARPSHQYWGFGAGTDFDTKIIVKVNAPEKLRETFEKRSWQGEMVMFSGNTDCYQPLEASYRLTRRCLEVCLEYRNPSHVITKSALVRRDVDVLAQLVKRARASVTLSIPFADDAMARKVEPFAARPSLRFEALRVLAEAGIEVSVNIAPIIPGLNDPDIPEILERAHAAGARGAGMIPVRLAAEVKPVFFERLAQAFPNRVARVTSALLQIRGGKLNESRFNERMTGVGPRWQAIRALFDAHCRRLGIEGYAEGDEDGPAGEGEADQPTTFRRPSRQGDLFDP